MASFFAKLKEAAASTVAEAVKTVGEMAANFSLDTLQDQYGDPTGRRAIYEGLDVTYLTPRLIAMGFPCTPDSRTRSRNDAAAVAMLLKERHDGHFMLWNAAEEGYDYSLFDNQVIEVRFPGFPAPPLGLLFKVCTSVENWLAADPSNVAVIHCMTGRGRTTLLSACVLAWLGEMDDAVTALGYAARRRAAALGLGTPLPPPPSAVGPDGTVAVGTAAASPPPPVERAPLSAEEAVAALCVPSQLRYARYFSRVLEGHPPAPGPLCLRRVIVNGVVDCSVAPEGERTSGDGSGGNSTSSSATAAGGAPAADASAAASGLAAVSRLASMVLDAADTADAALATGLLKAAVAVETAAVKTATLVAAGSGGASADAAGAGAAAAAADAPATSSAGAGAGGDPAALLHSVKEGGASLLHGVREVVTAAAAAARDTSLDNLPPPAAGGEGGAAATAAAAAISTLQHVLQAPEDDGADAGARKRRGFRPVLQLFRSGTLVWSSTWAATAPTGDADGEAAFPSAADDDAAAGSQPWVDPSEAAVRFPVDAPLAGDVLLRLRHAGDGATGSRETLLRAAVHVGFVDGSGSGALSLPGGSGGSGLPPTEEVATLQPGDAPAAAAASNAVLRMTKQQLDVARDDDRVPDDFFVELVFAPLGASDGGADQQAASTEATDGDAGSGDAGAEGRREGGDGSSGSGGGDGGDGGSSAQLPSGASSSLPSAGHHHSRPRVHPASALETDYDVELSAAAEEFWADIAARRQERAARRRRTDARSPAPSPGGSAAAAQDSTAQPTATTTPSIVPAPLSGMGPSTSDVLGSTHVPSSSVLMSRLQEQRKAQAAAAAAAAAAQSAAASQHQQSRRAGDGDDDVQQLTSPLRGVIGASSAGVLGSPSFASYGAAATPPATPATAAKPSGGGGAAGGGAGGWWGGLSAQLGLAEGGGAGAASPAGATAGVTPPSKTATARARASPPQAAAPTAKPAVVVAAPAAAVDELAELEAELAAVTGASAPATATAPSTPARPAAAPAPAPAAAAVVDLSEFEAELESAVAGLDAPPPMATPAPAVAAASRRVNEPPPTAAAGLTTPAPTVTVATSLKTVPLTSAAKPAASTRPPGGSGGGAPSSAAAAPDEASLEELEAYLDTL